MPTLVRSTIFGFVKAPFGRVRKAVANLGPHQQDGGVPPNRAKVTYNFASYTVVSFT